MGRHLRLAVGHIPSTALPGQAGNVGVAGHRDTFFRGLKDLRATDEIQFSTSTGNFSYEVESLMVVEPDNVEVLAASTDQHSNDGHVLPIFLYRKCAKTVHREGEAGVPANAVIAQLVKDPPSWRDETMDRR